MPDPLLEARILAAHRRTPDPHPQYLLRADVPAATGYDDSELRAQVEAAVEQSGNVDAALIEHKADTGNPHQVTADQVGAEAAGVAGYLMAEHVATYHPDHIDGGPFVGATFDRNADGGGF